MSAILKLELKKPQGEVKTTPPPPQTMIVCGIYSELI